MEYTIYSLILWFSSIWLVIAVFLGIWGLNVRAPRYILEKYPPKVVFLSQMPFSRYCERFVEKEDIEFFRYCQKRNKILLNCLIIVPCVLAASICLIIILRLSDFLK